MSSVLPTEAKPPYQRPLRYTVELGLLGPELTKVAKEFGSKRAEVVQRAVEFYISLMGYQAKGYLPCAFRDLPDGKLEVIPL